MKNRIMKRVKKVEEMKKTPVTSIILILNILIFVIIEITGSSENTMHMLNCGASHVSKTIWEHQYYRLVTSMFLHFGMTHLANNMLALFVLGGRLELYVGKIRYLIIYFLGGIAGNLLSVFWEFKKNSFAVSAGASGAVFAILGALIYLIIRNKGRIRDLSMRQIMIIAGLSLYLGFTGKRVDNMAHIGGMIGGFLVSFLLYPPRRIRSVQP